MSVSSKEQTVHATTSSITNVRPNGPIQFNSAGLSATIRTMENKTRYRYLTLLVKPASSLCNLRCRYCFYEDESENRNQKCYGIMTEETARTLISSAVEATKENAIISMAFQGGEPTVAGLDFFRHFIEEEKQYPKRHFIHSIQTNGYALDEEWALFFKENNFLVGISIDGYKELHDTYRVTPSGEGSFNKVSENLEYLKKYDVPTNALCVVTRQCAQKPHRVYNRLKGMGFRFLQFIACLDPIGKTRGQEDYSLLPEEYGRFLCATFDDWYADWKSGNGYTSVRLFDDYIHIMIGESPSSCAAMGKCGTYLVVEADGSLYPCDFYVLDDWRIGNIRELTLEQAIENERTKTFRSDEGKRPEECFKCKWFGICHGGCKRDITFRGNDAENYYCPAFKFFFEYAQDRLLEVAQAEYKAKIGL